ncbi:MAG: Choline-sulfatase [Verrucomicrobia subdivision 3 bacterium]|nr:Choline-sulfatase [Limisphaerales bacterium]MCS1416443.1 Choline-sulfatase [Limisphaerales bacterium]
MVETLDQSIGRVLQTLRDLNLDSNTVVLFTSDNGGLSTSEGSPTSNLPLRGGKGWLYEGGIREPYIIKWPNKAPAGSICETPVVSTDFYPTILEMAGLPLTAEQHLDGISLVPLLTQSGTITRTDLFWHYPHYSNQGGFPGGAIRSGDFKLIERFENGELQLYNLQADIGERVNLAEAKPGLVKRMRTKLHSWYQEVDATFLQPKPGGPQPWRPSSLSQY